MLLYFRVSNSRSIDKEIEISFMAGDYGDKLLKNIYHVKKYGFSVVKVLALYGANASGKSNILEAITDGCEIISDGIFDKHLEKKYLKKEAIFYPNKNNIENKNRPTTYTYGILVDEVCYEYQIATNNERIVSERLWKFEPNNSIPTTLFDRKYNEEKYVWFFNSIFNENMKNIIKSVTNPTTSLLSEMSNYIKNNDIKEYIYINNIFSWFNMNFFATQTNNLGSTFYLNESLRYTVENKKYKKALFKILHDGDFNIKSIKPKLNNNNEILSAYTTHIDAIEKERLYNLFTEESIGTQEFIGLFHLWYLAFEHNTILIVDEYGNSLHPLVAKYLVSLFYEKEENCQLLIATHHIELLNRKEIRDDQIYFVRRNKDNNTITYPLAKYIIPENTSLDKIYMQGLFNAAPFINNY